MGLPLLTFEDEFIDSICGISDDSIEARWDEAIEDGRLEMERAVRAKLYSNRATRQWAKRVKVTFDGDAYIVNVPEDIADELAEIELGTATDRPQGLLRGGLARGLTPAAKAITEGLDLP